MQVYISGKLLMWVESDYCRSFNSALYHSEFKDLGYSYGNVDLKFVNKLLFHKSARKIKR